MKALLIRLIWFYKDHLSERLGRECRYYPSCSVYALLALHNCPLPTALWKILGRFYRCSTLYRGRIERVDFPIGPAIMTPSSQLEGSLPREQVGGL
jgi:hypothetical protein